MERAIGRLRGVQGRGEVVRRVDEVPGQVLVWSSSCSGTKWSSKGGGGEQERGVVVQAQRGSHLGCVLASQSMQSRVTRLGETSRWISLQVETEKRRGHEQLALAKQDSIRQPEESTTTHQGQQGGVQAGCHQEPDEDRQHGEVVARQL